MSTGYVGIVGTCNEDVDCRGSCNNKDGLLAVATCLRIPFGVGKQCCCLTIDEKLGLDLSYTFIRLCLRRPESINGFDLIAASNIESTKNSFLVQHRGLMIGSSQV